MASELIIINNELVDGSACKDKVLRIPSEVTKIRDKSFSNNKFIEKIIVNAECRKIGEMAFDSCINLQEVTFEKDSKLRTIGESAFIRCSNLKKVEFPDKVEILNRVTHYHINEVKLPSGIRKLIEIKLGDNPFIFLPDTIELIENCGTQYRYLVHKKEKPKADDYSSLFIITGVIGDQMLEHGEFKYIVYEDENNEKGIALFYNKDNKVVVVPREIDGILVKKVYSYNSNRNNDRMIHRVFLPKTVECMEEGGYYKYIETKLEDSKITSVNKYNCVDQINFNNLIFDDVGIFVKCKDSVSLLACTSDDRTINIPKEVEGLKVKKVFRYAFDYPRDYIFRFISFPESAVLEDNALRDDHLFYNIGEKTYPGTLNLDHIINHPLYDIKVVGIAADSKGVYEFLLVEKDGNKEAIVIDGTMPYSCKILPSIPKNIQGYKVTMASIPFGQFYSQENNSIKKEDIITCFEQLNLDLV